MSKDKYIPANIEFSVATDNDIPYDLGTFENNDEVRKFIVKNDLVAINSPLTAKRFLDSIERRELREQYQEALEDSLPRFEKEHAKAIEDLNIAKKAEKEANAMVQAEITKAKTLAKEVKIGLADIVLEESNTYRLAIQGCYYYYTLINRKLKLCGIRIIPESEQDEIFNSHSNNDYLLRNEETEAQERSEEQLS